MPPTQDYYLVVYSSSFIRTATAILLHAFARCSTLYILQNMKPTDHT